LFPEARLKNTLEVRGCDSLPAYLSMAVPALFTGILYDNRALEAALELAAPLNLETVNRDRPALIRDGLSAPFGDKPALTFAQSLFDIASSGLSRRGRRNAQNEDERRFLKPLERLLSAGKCPADVLSEGMGPGDTLTPAEAIARCKIA
jgi:glutamate--cysteine ligase